MHLSRSQVNHQCVQDPVALAWLSDLLELPNPDVQDSGALTVVIISVAEKRLGLVVDDLVGEQSGLTGTDIRVERDLVTGGYHATASQRAGRNVARSVLHQDSARRRSPLTQGE